MLGIDFNDPENPLVERIDADFRGTGYTLCVVNTGGSHADLTPDYAAIPDEMRAAARIFGRDVARGLTMDELLASAPVLRAKVGDRAVLRLMHFIGEDARVVDQIEALRNGDMDTFLKLLNDSGRSSCRLLQNCCRPSSPSIQPIPLAIALTEEFLGGQGGCRVHGGGFAGTIQAFVPTHRLDGYTAFMETVFGSRAVIPLAIRQTGHEILRVNN